jgi:hypothetical protein
MVPVTVVGAGQNAQTFGNCGHFPTSGPGYKNLDSSIFKNFHYSERIYAQDKYRWKDSVQRDDEIRLWVADGIAHDLRP